MEIATANRTSTGLTDDVYSRSDEEAAQFPVNCKGAIDACLALLSSLAL